MSKIIFKLSQKMDGNEIKTNEIISKLEEGLKKIQKIEENDKKYLGNKIKRDEKTIDVYGNEDNEINNQNKRLKLDKAINEEINDRNNNDKLNKNNEIKNKSRERSKKSESNKRNKENERIRIKKENEEEENNKSEKEKVKEKEKEIEREKEKYSLKKSEEKGKERQKVKDKEKEIKLSQKFVLQKNKIEIIEEDSDSNKNKNASKEKNNIMSNLKAISSNIDKEKDRSLKKPSIVNIVDNTIDFKFCRDSHILNNKKIRWEILLKRLTGYVALGISGKKPEEHTTVILDNDNDNNEKVEEEIIPMANNDGILASSNMNFLLTNEKNTIIWKNGSNYKKTNSDLPVLKEGDNLTLIYCPKFSQLKIQKGDYIFIFENVGNKTRQLLNPCVIFGNKNDKALFHNFQILAEYNKK